MRPIHILLILPLLLFFGNSYCRAQNSAFNWKPIDAVSDELISKLELTDEDSDEFQLLVDSLYEYAFSTEHPVLKNRAIYWKATSNKNLNDVSADIRKINEIISQTDSVKYEYDAARMKYLQLYYQRRSDNNVEKYKQCEELLRLFSKYKDLRYMGNIYRYMGSIYCDLEQFEQALVFWT